MCHIYEASHACALHHTNCVCFWVHNDQPGHFQWHGFNAVSETHLHALGGGASGMGIFPMYF